MRQLLRRISSAWPRYRPIDAGCRSVLPRRERALRNIIESFGLAGLCGKGEGLRAQPLSGRIHDCRVGRGLLPISVPAAARPKCRSPCHGDRLDAGLTLAVVPGSRPNQRLCFIPRLLLIAAPALFGAGPWGRIAPDYARNRQRSGHPPATIERILDGSSSTRKLAVQTAIAEISPETSARRGISQMGTSEAYTSREGDFPATRRRTAQLRDGP